MEPAAETKDLQLHSSVYVRQVQSMCVCLVSSICYLRQTGTANKTETMKSMGRRPGRVVVSYLSLQSWWPNHGALNDALPSQLTDVGKHRFLRATARTAVHLLRDPKTS